MAFGLWPGNQAIEPLLTSSSPSFSPSLRTTKRTSLLSTIFGGMATSISCRGMDRRYNDKLSAMRFSVDHELPGPPAAVAAVLLDPKFHEQLDLPDMSRPEVVEASTTGTTSVLRLRYEFTGHLDAVVRKLLGNRKLTWLQELTFDMAMLRGRLTFAAEADPKRLNG